MTTLDQIANKIIKEQELIIGPLAWQEAGKVNGVHIIDAKSGAVTVENGDSRIVIDKLVSLYKQNLEVVRLYKQVEDLNRELEIANEGQANLLHIINHQIKGYLAKARNIFS